MLRRFGVALLLVGSGMASCEIVPVKGSQLLTPVFRSSDVVCGCVVLSRKTISESSQQVEGMPVTTRRVLAQVLMTESFKTPEPSQKQILVEFDEELPATRVGLPSLLVHESALLFLRSSGKGTYTFTAPFVGVTSFTTLPHTSGSEGIEKVEGFLSMELDSSGRDDRLKALNLLQELDSVSPDTTSKLSSLATSNDSALALAAIGAIVKASPAVGVQDLMKFLDSHRNVEPSEILQSIGFELWKVSDPDAVPALDSLSSSQILSIKLGAMQAIRQIRSRNSAETLIMRLDDPNKEVRFLAVKALAKIFDKSGEYDPDSRQYDNDPGHFSKLWLEWWRNSNTRN